MQLKVTNIKFPTVVSVPTDLTEVKAWLDDYDMVFETDLDAKLIYIRTALFYAADFPYDTELLETDGELEAENNTTCVCAFDHNHAEYYEQHIKVTVPESFVCYVTEASDLSYARTDDMTEQQVYEQVAFSRMINELPMTIELI